MKDNVTSVCIHMKRDDFLMCLVTAVSAFYQAAAPIRTEDLFDKKPPLNTTQGAVCFTLITHLIKQKIITGELTGDMQQLW